MRKVTVAVVLGSIVAVAGAAAAWEFQYNNAAMKVAFYSNSLGDPALVSRKDTKAAFQVEGEAAKQCLTPRLQIRKTLVGHSQIPNTGQVVTAYLFVLNQVKRRPCVVLVLMSIVERWYRGAFVS